MRPAKPKSLLTRFSWVTLVSLLTFSCVLAFILDRTFVRSLLETQQDRLSSMVYSLLASIETSPNGGLIVEESLISRDLMESDTVDLALLDGQARMLWQKENLPLPDIQTSKIEKGQWVFTKNWTQPLSFAMQFGFEWQEQNQTQQYIILARETSDWYDFELRQFRHTLALWLALGCLALFLIQRFLLQIGFRPLQTVAQEIDLIEAGQQHQFQKTYPRELQPLTHGINSLLRHERQQQIRFRQALDHLAHALKTPLSAISTMAQHQQTDENFWPTLQEQVQRADSIVAHQLQKAATVGKTAFTQPQNLLPALEQISRSLQKVYAAKDLHIDLQVPPTAQWVIDASDMMELLGNLMENAAKYAKQWVGVTWAVQDQRNVLHIEDDGPGFDLNNMASILQRGVRQDQQMEGQGLGLTLAYEIVSLLEGQIIFDKSSKGGAKVSIVIASM
jgi:two-component system sensor histidine kinase PhoQ